MSKNAKWGIAALVTAAVFTLCTWIPAAIVLPHRLKDDVVRWAVATAFGLAMAGLAALWGKAYATDPKAPTAQGDTRERSATTVVASNVRSVAVGEDNFGPIAAGNDVSAPSHVSPGQATPAARPAPRNVEAGGERSIAIGGSNYAPLSTGDQSGDSTR